MTNRHNARRSKNGHRSRLEPYQWLGAGAVALGLGIAVANGTGVAYADDGTGSAPPSASSAQNDAGQSPGDNEGDGAENEDQNDIDKVDDNDDDTPDGEATDDEATDLDEADELGADNEDDFDDVGVDDLDIDEDLDDLDIDEVTTPVDEVATPDAAATQRPTSVDELAAEAQIPAETTATEVEPAVPESPVSAVLPELLAPTGVNTDPSAPPAAPALSELVVAAYRPTNQRGLNVSAASLRTTSESAPSGTPPLAAAATPSAIIDRILLGSGLPYTVVASPDGHTVYVITTGLPAGGSLPTSTVYGIDTRTNRRVGEPITVGYVPGGSFSTNAKPLTFSPDGKRVYVSSIAQGASGQISSSVTVIDAASGQVAGDAIGLGNVTTTGLVVSPDGRRLYTANSDSTVTVIDLQHNNTLVGTVPIGIFSGPSSPGSPAIDIVIAQNDAQTVYITDYAERSVYVLNAATNTTNPDPILIDGNPISLALSPDGSRLFVNTVTFSDPLGATTNQANLVVVNTSTNAIVGSPISYGTAAQGLSTNGVLLVSPDSRYVYTESFQTAQGTTPSGTLWKIDTTTGAVQSLASGLYPSAPVLSPDGTRVYVPAVAVVDGQPQLAVGAVSTADGSMITRIPIDIGAPMGTAVSTDGTRLYVGQLLTGADPTSLSGQLAVIDTGTSNTVTPPRAVNPITLIVRSVTNAVRASVQTIAHALRQSVETVTKALGTLSDTARQSVVGFGQQVANAVQNVVQAARNIAGSFGDTARSWARESLNFSYGVGQVVQAIPDAIRIGVQQAQRETQKRLDDLRRFAKTVQGNLGRAADNAAKFVAPAAKRLEKLAKVARVAGPVGLVFAVYDLFFGGPSVS